MGVWLRGGRNCGFWGAPILHVPRNCSVFQGSSHKFGGASETVQGANEEGQQDREPLKGKSASERVSERVSEREGFQRFSEVLSNFPLRGSQSSLELSPNPAPHCVPDFPRSMSRPV